METAIPSIRVPDPSGRSLASIIEDAPPSATIELAPGRYEGTLELRRPITLKGAGDLTRLIGDSGRPAIEIDCKARGLIFIESVSVTSSRGGDGGGVRVCRGRVRMYNVHGSDCTARGDGGFLWVGGGEVEASLLRVDGCSAARGGAIALAQADRFILRDSEIRDCSAERGGGLFAGPGPAPQLSSVVFGGTRATKPSGGQVVCFEGPRSGDVVLHRVRFEDAPLGQPLVLQGEGQARLVIRRCDMPSDVLRNPGIVDEGHNRWR